MQRYNGPGNAYDNAFALRLDNSGNCYVTGFSSQGGSNEDWATIKYDSLGTQKWLQRFNGSGNIADEANAIEIDALGNVYVTGYSSGATSYDFTTIKYSQPITEVPNSLEIPKDFLLLQNYPNPFNPNTAINYKIPKTSFISIRVYDLLGSEVATLVHEEMNAGSYVMNFDASHLASGVYFCRLQAQGFSATRSMLLTK